MRLLVTRPDPEASELAQTLSALGHQVIVQSLMRVALNPEPAGLPRPSAIAVTSRNGLRALAAWPSSAGWRRTPVYAVGAATAETAHDAGFTDVRAGTGDVGALAKLVRSNVNPRDMVLYPAARDRSADLAALLPDHFVRTVEAYSAEPAAALDPHVLEALRGGQLDGVLLFSRRTADVFARLVVKGGVRAGLTHVTLYCLAQQVSEPVGGLAGRVLVAPHPRQDDLLTLLDPTLADRS